MARFCKVFFFNLVPGRSPQLVFAECLKDSGLPKISAARFCIFFHVFGLPGGLRGVFQGCGIPRTSASPFRIVFQGNGTPGHSVRGTHKRRACKNSCRPNLAGRIGNLGPLPRLVSKRDPRFRHCPRLSPSCFSSLSHLPFGPPPLPLRAPLVGTPLKKNPFLS